MSIGFPYEFTLENGTHVIVKKDDRHHYDFHLKPKDGASSHFIYNNKETFTTEREKKLTFDQLNALRRFWLEQEKEEM